MQNSHEPINLKIEQINKERLGTENGLVWGGAVYEKLYLESSPRVLFLMKEANCQGPKEVWGLPWHLKNQVTGVPDGPLTSPRFYKNWKFAGCMMAGITGNMPNYRTITAKGDEYFEETCKKGLSGIAVINLKKTPGKSESDPAELLEYIRERNHLQLLMEEMRILAPQLVICGGTYDLLVQAVPIPQRLEREWPCGAKTFVMPGSDAIFLEFVHPSIRGIKRNVLYTYLQCAYYDIKLEQGW